MPDAEVPSVRTPPLLTFRGVLHALGLHQGPRGQWQRCPRRLGHAGWLCHLMWSYSYIYIHQHPSLRELCNPKDTLSCIDVASSPAYLGCYKKKCKIK